MAMGVKHRVTAVTISYNCKENVFRLVDSLQKSTYKNLDVVVVDNGSSDGTLEEGRRKYKNVRWIDAGSENIGWGGSYNVGFASAKKGSHILMIDSDVTVESEAIENLARRLESSKKIGIVTPMILYLCDHDWVNQAGSEINLVTGIVKVGWGPKENFQKACRVQNSGTVLLIKNKVVRKIGGFDNWFIVFLDPDYCLRALKAGYETWYEPRAVVYHDQSKDKNVWGPRLFKRAYITARNRTLFMRRHGTNLAVYVLVAPLIWLYYLKESLKYGLFLDWLKLVWGAINGFFYKLNPEDRIPLPDVEEFLSGRKEFHFFALAAHGTGISGGDRIMIELSRRWSKKMSIKIYVWEEGGQMLQRQGLGGAKLKAKDIKLSLKISKMKSWGKFGFVIGYIARILEGIRLGLTLNLSSHSTGSMLPATYIYSASDFWMDVLPCAILKLRNPKLKWIAGWYQTAPNPLSGFSGGRYKFSAMLYWLSQLPMKPLVLHLADFVFVNNESERKQFSKLNKKGRIFVFIGAVPLADIGKWKLENARLSSGQGKSPKVYDAVFQGRVHPPKGVVELIDIWKKVVDVLPDAKLAMVGDGPLMQEVRSKIQDLGMENNIKLFGFVFDGPKKYKIFAQSKLVVHPAYYDSGGMAAAEAMAFDLPCVGFDLPAYKSYYPKGMLKVPLGDKDAFVNATVKLLKDRSANKKLAKEALEMINANWSWDKRADQVLEFINAEN
jgi:GT2 family glycosyltransferase